MSGERPSRLARIMRRLGDVFVTIGMAKGFSGQGRPSDAAATNVMLFGEGTNPEHPTGGTDEGSAETDWPRS